MAAPGDTPLLTVSAALAWWREAGVDLGFEDAPRQWIAAPASLATDQSASPGEPERIPAITAPPPAPRTPQIGDDPPNWPGDLAAFAPWWLAEPSLDGGQVRGRIPPRGASGAALMVVVPQPEAQDSESLLAGPQGRLLAAMLAAMGLADDQVYVASALPRHTPMADWADVANQGLGAVLLHHVALVRPRRLIAFGRHFSQMLAPAGLAPPRADNAPAQNSASLPQLSHEGGSTPLWVAPDLGSLLERPAAKGRFWQHWLEWSVTE